MTVTFVPYIPFVDCKHPFLYSLKDKNSLPQCRQLNNFIERNNITDIEFNDYTQSREMIGLIINDGYCSLSALEKSIVGAAAVAQQYLYLAVNKFYIYSQNNLKVTDTNYDSRLITYCRDVIADDFVLIDYALRPDDTGLLGNFVHPVTTMFFKRYD